MKDVYSCLWFDNQAELAAHTWLEELLRDRDKQQSNRAMKALLQMGKLDLQGMNNAAAA